MEAAAPAPDQRPASPPAVDGSLEPPAVAAAAAEPQGDEWRIHADLAPGAVVDVGGEEEPPGASRGASPEPHSDEAFYRQSRHVFVLSSAGKPIYARHGEEDRLATLMPMISAIYDQFDDQGDPIQCIAAGGHRFVFHKRDPLYLLAISDQRDPEIFLIQQMEYVYASIVSLVTDSRLQALQRNLRMDISSHLEPHVITELYDAMDRPPPALSPLPTSRALPSSARSADGVGRRACVQATLATCSAAGTACRWTWRSGSR